MELYLALFRLSREPGIDSLHMHGHVHVISPRSGGNQIFTAFYPFMVLHHGWLSHWRHFLAVENPHREVGAQEMKFKKTVCCFFNHSEWQTNVPLANNMPFNYMPTFSKIVALLYNYMIYGLSHNRNNIKLWERSQSLVGDLITIQDSYTTTTHCTHH